MSAKGEENEGNLCFVSRVSLLEPECWGRGGLWLAVSTYPKRLLTIMRVPDSPMNELCPPQARVEAAVV